MDNPSNLDNPSSPGGGEDCVLSTEGWCGLLAQGLVQLVILPRYMNIDSCICNLSLSLSLSPSSDDNPSSPDNPGSPDQLCTDVQVQAAGGAGRRAGAVQTRPHSRVTHRPFSPAKTTQHLLLDIYNSIVQSP